VISRPLKVGVVGCGDVATTRYLPYLAHRSPFVSITACADLDPGKAARAGDEFSLQALAPAELIEHPEIDVVLNLTPPLAHKEITAWALERGKHVYSEKPFALTLTEGEELNGLARQAGRHLASAPDTILGPNIQLARRLIGEGRIGTPFMASMSFVTADRSWHPNPEFFYRRGAGPIFDEAPYFLSALVALLGPVREVSAYAASFIPEIEISGGPGKETTFRAEVPTSYVAGLRLESGTLATMIMSFDVRGTTMPPVEIYGREGTLRLDFPGYYNGPVLFGTEHDHISEVIRPEWETDGEDARGIGVEELAASICLDMASRLEGEFPLHLLEVMEALVTSGETGRPVAISTSTERPSPYVPAENPRNRISPVREPGSNSEGG
jgi:predicted dehydrogenase